MNHNRKPRRYRNVLEFVEDGYRACRRNASDLITSSKTLLDQNLHAPALSLSVLALEEMGKMCAIDGLLFARPDDHKAQTFNKSQRDHETKLAALYLLPLFIRNLSLVDPRSELDAAFAGELSISLSQLQTDGDAVLQPLGTEGFGGLNRWKQHGFYAALKNNSFVVPADSVDRKYAESLQRFSWRAMTTLDFVLGNGNLERYLEQARSIRGNLDEAAHASLEQLGLQIASKIFDTEIDRAHDNTMN